MKTKFISIIVICIIYLSTLIVGWNFDSNAKNADYEINSTSPTRSNDNPPRAGDFDWGEIEVISEPILKQDNNINQSRKPKIAVEDDKIYVVWSDNTDYNGAGGDYDIFFRYFDGTKWSEIQVISEAIEGLDLNIKGSYNPSIAVENEKIFVVWFDYNNTHNSGPDSDIFYRCNITGLSWEPIQVISEPIIGFDNNVGDSGLPKIEVENDKIYVAWQDYSDIDNSGIEGEILFRCNLTGSSWDTIQIISEPVLGYNINTGASIGPDIAVENGKIYLVWMDSNDTYNAGLDLDIFFRCNLTGYGWETVQVISEPVEGYNINTGHSQDPSISVENCKIYIIWWDLTNTNGAGEDMDIFYKCNLTGYSWENVQVISEPIYGQNNNIGDSLYPRIAVEYNKIYVVWYDFNNTNNASGDFDIFYKCNLTGSAWENVQVISEPIPGKNSNTFESKWPDIFVDQGKSHIIWQDKNNTNGANTDWDIFYRNVSLPIILSLPGVAPTLGNTSTEFNFTFKYTHLLNMSPTKIIVKISGTEYTMIEVDQTDTNYIDGKDYYFKVKNLDIGTHTYQFYATDDTFIWITPLMNNPIVYNTPPNITTKDNITAFEDIYYEVEYKFEDIDVTNIDQLIFWNISTNANWLEFDQLTGILNGTPMNDDEGEYWVNITINDTLSTDFTNFTLTVQGINDRPDIMTDDIAIAFEDELYKVDYDAEDIDNTPGELYWDINTNASWLTFDQINAIINGTPLNDDVGEYWVNISVSDGEYIDFSNFTLKVLNVNDPPRIITIDNLTAIEDELYEVKYEAEDVDNAPYELNWDFASNAKWLLFDTTTLSIKGLPTNDDVGDYWINVSLSDTEYIDYTNFTLTVININDPPVITTEDKTNAVTGELYSVNYEAVEIDPTNDKLSWSLITDAGDWLTIDTATGWLNGVPSKNDYGTYQVNISVTDGNSGWDHHNFTLLVSMENNAPELLNGSITPSEGDINTEFTFSVRYYDVDRQAPLFIQVIIDNILYYMKLQPGENAFNGTYEYSFTLSEGTHYYYFTASDGLETVKTNNFTTPEIKKVITKSKHELAWYWLILVVIIIIILLLAMSIFIYKKRKAAKIPTVRVELMHVPPKHIALPGEISSIERAKPLPAQAIITEQLPAPKIQAQPTTVTTGEKVPVPTLTPSPMTTQFQLPQATLSKAQKLGLLQERFLRGEVAEETYNKLRSEIEGSANEDITDINKELEEQPAIGEHPSGPIEEPTKVEGVPSSTTESEPIGKPSQQLQIEPKSISQPPQTEIPEVTVSKPEQTTQELPQTPEPKHETPQPPQVTQQQSLPQTQQPPKPIVKELTDEE